MINLSLDQKIKVGSKVVYSMPMQTFNDNTTSKKYRDIDVSNAVGIVLSIINENNYEIKFNDVSFLPSEIQHCDIWYVMKIAIEPY